MPSPPLRQPTSSSLDRANEREGVFARVDHDESVEIAQAPRRWWASFDDWHSQNLYEGFVLA